jgi:hypothetical protein
MMTTAMKRLAEMTTGELEALKAECGEMIHRLVIKRLPAAELIGFERAIDDELDRRGA